MPPQNSVPPPPAEKQLPLKAIIGAIISLVLLGAVALALSWSSLSTIQTQTPSLIVPFPKDAPPIAAGSINAQVAQIARLKSDGKYVEAMAVYTDVMYRTDTTPDQRARATLYISWARFNNSGNVQDLVYDIIEMKKYALNEDVQDPIRVLLINTIGTAYGTRNDTIFEAVYSGPTFEDFRVEGDGTLSGKNLYEWSYSIKPTAHAAVRIARWYIETSLFQKPEKVPKDEILKRREIAARYLREAKVLDDAARAQYDNFENSTDHMQFLYWYALESSYIARLKEPSFVASYKAAWADFFDEAGKSGVGATKQKIPYARYFYANALFKIDNDRAEAKVQLDLAVDAVKTDPNPKANQFVEFVRNGGISVDELKYMRGISDTFDAFLASVGK